MSIRLSLYYIFCLIAGGAIAGGYVAFITLIGVFEKLSKKYEAARYARLIETLIISGVTIGTICQLCEISLPFGIVGYFIFNIFGGIFVGCLAGALAETINIFPIISRRFAIRENLPYVLMAAGLGKAIGSILHLLIINKL